MKGVVSGKNHAIGGLELSFPHPDFWGGKKGWSWTQSPMTNDLIKQGFVAKLS